MMIDLTEDTETTPTPPRKQIPWMLIAVIAFAGYLFWVDRRSAPPQPDDQTIVDGDTRPNPAPQPTPANLKDTTLVFVVEALTTSAEQMDVMLSVTNDGLRSKYGMEGFRRYDDDQAEVQKLIEFAVAKNTPPPFVALMKDKQPIKLAPFPKTPLDLEAFLR
jgi:hypothetical protein